MRRVDSAAYADSDWKLLAADFDLTPAEEGETIATMLGEELPAPVEEVQPVVEAATEVVETEADEEVKED